MRFLRSVLAPVAALALLLSTAAAPLRLARADAPASFPDLKGHWSEATVRRAIDLGIVSGFPDNTFQPDRPITRAEYVKMLVIAGHLQPQGSGLPFQDMEHHWLQTNGFLLPAWSSGVLSPYDYANQLHPDEPIPRQEMAVLAERLLGRIALAQEWRGTALLLSDSDSVAAWARGYVQLALQDQTLAGYPDGTFRPSQGATRAEAVSVILRTLDAMLLGLDPGLKLYVGGTDVTPAAPLAPAIRDGYVYIPARYVYGSAAGIKTYTSLTQTSGLHFYLRPGNDLFTYAERPQLHIPVGSNQWTYDTQKPDGATSQGTLPANTYRLYGELMIPVAKVGGEGAIPFAKAHHDAQGRTITIDLQPDWPGNQLPTTLEQAKIDFWWHPPAQLPPGASNLPTLATFDNAGRRIEPLTAMQFQYHIDPSSPLRLKLSNSPELKTDLTIPARDAHTAYLEIPDETPDGTYAVTLGATGNPQTLTWNLNVVDNRAYKLVLDSIPAGQRGQPQTITVRLLDRHDRPVAETYHHFFGPTLSVTLPDGSTDEAYANETMDQMDNTLYMYHGVATYRFTPPTAGTYTYTATMKLLPSGRTIQPGTATAIVAP